MHEQDLFEYAVIRIVPRVERGEFLNAGVILYCAKQKFLKAKWGLDQQRLKALSGTIDMDDLVKNLEAFGHISDGDEDSGPIAKLDAASRFRWLTATRSTILQTSKVHPGLCKDPEGALNKLYSELVL